MDILNPWTGQQPSMWAAYEQIAELAGIISSLSSSPLPCDYGFCASLSESDPTAPFTSAWIYCFRVAESLCLSREWGISNSSRFCSQEIAQAQGNLEMVERP